MDFQRLVATFERNVIAQTEALRQGDYKSGNRFARRYVRAFEQLRAAGDEGREALTVLVDHERRDVRVMAAAFLLRYKNAQATAVLQEAAKGEGLAAFGASQSLKRWQEGARSLDPDDKE